MTDGAADERPHELTAPWRGWCLLGAALVARGLPGAAALRHGPPLRVRRGPAVLPPRHRGAGFWSPSVPRGGASGWPDPASPSPPRLADRLADRRLPAPGAPLVPGLHRCRPGRGRGLARPGGCRSGGRARLADAAGGCDPVGLRPGPLARAGGLAPLEPRSGYLRRAVLAAVAMWAFWILAYVLGLSNHDFYRNFPHVPGGLSAAADQQIASAVLWFVAAASFVPVIFWNALHVAPDRRGPRHRAPGAGAGRAPAGHAAADRDAGRRRHESLRSLSRRSSRRPRGGRPGAGGCRAPGPPPSPGPAPCPGPPPAETPPSRGCAAPTGCRVVHERLHVLDRPQRVRGRPQRGGRHQLAQVLARRGRGTWMLARS